MKRRVMASGIVLLLLATATHATWLDSGYESANAVDGDCPTNKNAPSRYRFSACNCTDYVAYWLNSMLDQHSATNPMFTNHYYGYSWGDAYKWKYAIGNGVPGYFSTRPVESFDRDGLNQWHIISGEPYDTSVVVAYWNQDDPSDPNDRGHVARVKKAYSDDKVVVGEYNWPSSSNGNRWHVYGERTLSPGESGYPDGFLYIANSSFFECDLMGDMCMDSGLPGGGGGGTTPIGTDPQPIPGPRVDLRPDFDIKDTDNDELSSNCDNCNTKPLRPNQEIKLVLTTQVSNEDAGNFKRDDDSDSIEGPIWYRMGEGDSWHLIASGEYTIGKLDEGDSIQETIRWRVPNVPGGTIHFAACVDGDDEIWEEGETDDDDSISSPDDNKAKTNNCSRIERFKIKERPDLRARITLTPSQEFYDALSGISITVRGYAFRDHADKHERWGVPKVKAPLWYRIPGVDGHENWTLIATPQYTTGKLDEGDSVPDTVSWTIPNFPGKTVELASCIDSEDAIYEFDEPAASHPITNPDTGGANCTFTNLKTTDPDPVENPDIDPNDYEHVSPTTLRIIFGN